MNNKLRIIINVRYDLAREINNNLTGRVELGSFIINSTYNKLNGNRILTKI